MRSSVLFLLVVGILAGSVFWYIHHNRLPATERAERYFKEGSELGDRGKFKEAIKRLEKAVKLNPRHADAHGVLGDCYYQEHRTEMAKQEYAKALELDPSAAETRVAYAGCLLKTTHNKDQAWKMANRELNKLGEKDLRNPYVAYNLACLYAENARPEMALRYLSYAVKTERSFREIAKRDRCLNSIRETEQFRRLVH